LAGLHDAREVLASGALPDATVTADDETMVLATVAQRPTRVSASLDADLVERRFYERLDAGDLATPEGVNSYDLWIRSRRFDDTGAPYLKITDEATGTLYRVDFTVSGSDVNFGDFTEVVEQDVPVAAGMARPAAPMAQWATREASRAVLASQSTTEDDAPMTDAQRRALALAYGLPETATEDEVNAAVSAGDPTTQPASAGTEGEPGTGASTEGEPAEPVAEPVAAGLTLPPGTVLVSEAQWTATNDRLASVESTVTAQTRAADTARRDGIITAALTAGRIAPAEREHYRAMLDENEQRATELLAMLAPGRVPTPVTAGGTLPGGGDVVEGDDAAQHEAYMRRHFPNAVAKMANRRAGTGVSHRGEE
jgi:hypothetical protein